MAKIKILLVDDEVDLLELMSKRIESWGYDLIVATNGKAALNMLKSKEPDIIVLDYMMPDMDGVATLKKIRAMYNKIPVIMFTAFPDEKSIEGAEELGVISYVPKLSAYADTQSALKEAIHIAEKKLTKKE